MDELELGPNEVVREIPGFPRYFASNLGRIWSDKSKKWLSLQTTHTGYRRAMLSLDGAYRTHAVHRLVLFAFVGPPGPDQECRHLNGDSLDNCLDNLKWGTHVENWSDRFRHGTANDGPRNCRSKLSVEQIGEIRRRYSEGQKQVHLAKEYGVTQANISYIVLRKGWKQYA